MLGDLFERRVPGAFAQPVHGAFDLARARINRGEGVRHGQAQIVVAVGGDDDPADVRGVLLNVYHQPCVFLGHGIAHGVRNVDGSRSRVDHGGTDAR
ncbi:hypothetical protein SDC9_209730 [bioreactor metagenome]|uniref:Uncharacterized protein n=1 Tax=bioreactor metagenome TaxID=1076179 RepID=A0A645JNT7_9ZZZZ